VGLIARVLEEAGIATVCIIMRREVAQNVKPSRSLFVKFPFGAPLGPAGDADTQRGVILEALSVLTTVTEPGAIVDSPRAWKRPIRSNP
jgi:D-proline reductase (dithiol) PrdB